MEYFKINEKQNFIDNIDTRYNSNNPGTIWFFDTRHKLQYLFNEISKRLNIPLVNNYNEKPNGMAGYGKGFKLKFYVLTGFIEKKFQSKIKKKCFLKLQFYVHEEELYFSSDIDVNFSDSKNNFSADRNILQQNTSKSWKVDETFPKDWNSLIDLILPFVSENIEFLGNYITKQLLPMIESPSEESVENTLSKIPLNQILYGPPGTGKTFNTINEALKIVDPIYFTTHQNDRKKLTNRFKELLIKNADENKGQIAFCTFHQSFSYEDFVEGIKPKTTESKGIYYDIEPGIFKSICQLADSNNSTIKIIKEGKLSWNEQQYNTASFYKISLGTYNNPNDRPIYEFCRDNGYIAIGFGQENDFSNLSESEITKKAEDLKLEVTAAQQMNYFIHYLKKGNYVLVSNGNKYIRALGKVTGDYEYWEESPIHYNHFRKVEWLFVDELIPIEELYERGLSQRTIYKIDESALKKEFFTNQGQQQAFEAKEDKKFVLIIDEINRGNVSSIFGELITLIEKDKRAGCDEELEVTLPYSKEPFKVPNNVYLIGTMNTADRSVEALDTALRRRFSFTEMMPEYDDLVKIQFRDFNLGELLNIINDRIEVLLDRDHTIGHSYFIKLKNNDIEGLKQVFKNCIIPLLQEYFYGDYEKIGLIIGKDFFEKYTKYNKDIFASFPTQQYPDNGTILRLKEIDEDFDIIKAVRSLLNIRISEISETKNE